MEAKMKELEADLAELKLLEAQASRSKVKETMTVAIRKIETQILSCKEKLETADKEKSSDKNVVTTVPAKNIIPEVHLKDYSHDQSEKFVKIYLTGLAGLDTLNSEAVKVSYTHDSLNVRIENLKGKTYLFGIKKTCQNISPDKSYHKVKSDYLLIFMAKHNTGSHWSHVTHAEKIAADAKKATETKTDYGADPSKGLMDMMKKMYDEGDDDMKRTIAEAWTKSREDTAAGKFGLDL